MLCRDACLVQWMTEDMMVGWRDRIAADPEVAGGKPVVAGTRLSVDFVVGLLAQGWTAEDLLESYPVLQAEDIQACLAYAAALLESERVYPVKAS